MEHKLKERSTLGAVGRVKGVYISKENYRFDTESSKLLSCPVNIHVNAQAVENRDPKYLLGISSL